jgi:hypothetical protein
MIQRYYKNIPPESMKRGRFKMAIEKHLEKLITPKSANTNKDKETNSVKEMESYFELDKVEPIKLSDSDEKDVKDKGDCFQDWYELELRKLYGKND